MRKPQQGRRFFSAEFKLEALRLAEARQAAGVPLTQIGRELGVSDDLLRTWRQQARAREGVAAADRAAGSGRPSSDEDARRRLERENAQLRQENAFLKSAAAYFARESRAGGPAMQGIRP